MSTPGFASVGISGDECGLTNSSDEQEVLACLATFVADGFTEPGDFFRMVEYGRIPEAERYGRDTYYIVVDIEGHKYEIITHIVMLFSPLPADEMLLMGYFRIGGSGLTDEELETINKIFGTFQLRIKPKTDLGSKLRWSRFCCC